MMEIVSGKARGVTLHSPAWDGVRPTSVRARKALFDSLGDLSGVVFADLFAGVGTVGLEAASRGASVVLFVDSSSASLKTLGRNAEKVRRLGVETDFRILHGSLPALSGRLAAEVRPAYIFADPPYEMLRNFDTAIKILNLIGNFLSPEGIAVLEAPSEFELFSGKGVLNFELTQIRRLGKKSKGKPTQLLISLKEND